MFALIAIVAIIGFVAYLIITYLPMPAPFQGLVILLACLLALGLILGGGGVGGFHLGSLGRC